jgi:hypothetical protein
LRLLGTAFVPALQVPVGNHEKGISMANLDRILDRYELNALEAALARRRSREEQKLTALKTRRQELEAELGKLNAQIDGRAGTSAGRKRGGASRGSRPEAEGSKLTLSEALTQVLKKRKKPMHYKDLTDTVLKTGLYRSRSKNPLAVVAVTLVTDRRFKRVGSGMYALR